MNMKKSQNNQLMNIVEKLEALKSNPQKTVSNSNAGLSTIIKEHLSLFEKQLQLNIEEDNKEKREIEERRRVKLLEDTIGSYELNDAQKLRMAVQQFEAFPLREGNHCTQFSN
jgi:hypothetical protein